MNMFAPEDLVLVSPRHLAGSGTRLTDALGPDPPVRLVLRTRPGQRAHPPRQSLRAGQRTHDERPHLTADSRSRRALTATLARPRSTPPAAIRPTARPGATRATTR